MIGQKSSYALSSIEKVIGPSLKRLSEKNIGEDLKQAYKDNKRVGKKTEKSEKHSACISDDVLHIIRSTPEYLDSKSEEAFLWLLSLYTGARSITATSVLWRDLSYFENVLRIKFTVTKGN